MPIDVRQLQPGERVVLNCPKARFEQKREALFEGIFRSIKEAAARSVAEGRIDLLGGSTAAAFLNGGQPWARFLFQRVAGGGLRMRQPDGTRVTLPEGITELVGAFAVEADGTLRDETGRRIFIERRVLMGQG
jgi:hypothetical protein